MHAAGCKHVLFVTGGAPAHPWSVPNILVSLVHNDLLMLGNCSDCLVMGLMGLMGLCLVGMISHYAQAGHAQTNLYHPSTCASPSPHPAGSPLSSHWCAPSASAHEQYSSMALQPEQAISSLLLQLFIAVWAEKRQLVIAAFYCSLGRKTAACRWTGQREHNQNVLPTA